jgi:pimeloyl-ACP methyl ester carboxylesterase
MLNYRVTGDGFPVVLLHGYMESLHMWDGLFDELNHFSWLAVDLPGHGDTPLVGEEMEPSVDWFASKVFDFLNEMGIENCHLVGHSMGGYVALQLKKCAPQRIKKVVLLNSHPWEDSALKKSDRLRIAEIAYKAKSLFIQQAIPALFYDSDGFKLQINQLIQDANKMTSDAIAYAALAMRNREDTSDVVKGHKDQLLFIQGKFDPLIPSDRLVEFAKLNQLKLIVFEKCGHMAHFEEPVNVKNTIQSFLIE